MFSAVRCKQFQKMYYHGEFRVTIYLHFCLSHWKGNQSALTVAVVMMQPDRAAALAGNPHTIQTILLLKCPRIFSGFHTKRREYLILQCHLPFSGSFIISLCVAFIHTQPSLEHVHLIIMLQRVLRIRCRTQFLEKAKALVMHYLQGARRK